MVEKGRLLRECVRRGGRVAPVALKAEDDPLAGPGFGWMSPDSNILMREQGCLFTRNRAGGDG